MKKLFLVSLSIFCLTVSAQTTYRRNSTNVLVSTTYKTPVTAVATGDVIIIKDVIYSVYRNSKGKFYINKVSKKTGKPYKQYIKIEN